MTVTKCSIELWLSSLLFQPIFQIILAYLCLSLHGKVATHGRQCWGEPKCDTGTMEPLYGQNEWPQNCQLSMPSKPPHGDAEHHVEPVKSWFLFLVGWQGGRQVVTVREGRTPQVVYAVTWPWDLPLVGLGPRYSWYLFFFTLTQASLAYSGAVLLQLAPCFYCHLLLGAVRPAR